MSRSLTTIYNEAVEYRNKYLELTEVNNDSKMSVINAFTWVVSALIYSFENILDVFTIDIAEILSNRINGTPAYFANALLKYQSGDDLIINDEGTGFSYANIDESKRIITKVSYAEIFEEGFHDKLMVLKIATGTPGQYSRISEEEMIKIKNYLNSILFAGQHAHIISRIGDILVPKLTVYYDGAVLEDEMFSSIESSINNFIANIDFDGAVYAQKVIDCIQSVEHVTDVYIDENATEEQGVFVAQYGDDNNLMETDGKKLIPIVRYIIPNSGYLKQSSGKGDEENIPNFRNSIVLKVEDKIKGGSVIGMCNCANNCTCVK